MQQATEFFDRSAMSDAKALALAAKNAGNKALAEKNFKAAVQHYTEVSWQGPAVGVTWQRRLQALARRFLLARACPSHNSS